MSINDVENIRGNSLEIMQDMESDSVDLVFGSPPYEDARTYDIDFRLKGQDWVDWFLPFVREACRISSGLVAFVVQGRTRRYQWSATPALLMADLHRSGICLRNPAIYRRDGIPGSGGRDYLASKYEWIVVAQETARRLPWSDNTVMGHPPKCKPGGRPSHRRADGTRVSGREYTPPKLANPGNVVECGAVGGGNMGKTGKYSKDSEAPFPERLPEFFIRSFCKPGGIVLDPFGGSGTTAAVAVAHGRRAISIDVREGQREITRRRLLGE